jgi:hypothetical protein
MPRSLFELVEDVRLQTDGVDTNWMTMPIGGGEPRRQRHTGIKALMLAVLEDALRCYWSPVDRIRSEAEYWATNTRRDSPFCFPTVCEILGLDAEAVRAAMAQRRAVYASPRQALRRSRPNVRRASRVILGSVQSRSQLRR